MKPSMKQCIEAFLELRFAEPERPFKTQREAREEAMRVVGFTQAQEALRHILSQSSAGTARDLAEVRSDGQLKSMAGPGDMRLWTPPEYEVRER